MRFCSFVGWTEWYLTKIGQKPNGFDSSLHLRIFVFAKLGFKASSSALFGHQIALNMLLQSAHDWPILPRIWSGQKTSSCPETSQVSQVQGAEYTLQSTQSRTARKNTFHKQWVRCWEVSLAKSYSPFVESKSCQTFHQMSCKVSNHIGWSPWLWQSTIPQIGKLQLRNRFIAGSKAPFCIICMQWSVVCRGRQSTVWYWMMTLWRLRAGCRKPCKTSRTWNKEPMEAKENIGQFWKLFQPVWGNQRQNWHLRNSFSVASPLLYGSNTLWIAGLRLQMSSFDAFFVVLERRRICCCSLWFFGPRAKPIWTGWWGMLSCILMEHVTWLRRICFTGHGPRRVASYSIWGITSMGRLLIFQSVHFSTSTDIWVPCGQRPRAYFSMAAWWLAFPTSLANGLAEFASSMKACGGNLKSRDLVQLMWLEGSWRWGL